MFKSLVLAVIVSACMASPAVAASPPARVLIVGDSMTQSDDGEYSWRYFLWKGLAQTGASVEFVGPRRGSYGGTDIWGGTYADPAFDQDHASRWGLALAEMLRATSKRAPSIERLILDHRPDVLIEALGINDLAWLERSPELVREDLRVLVERAQAADPHVDVVLVEIPQTWIDGVPELNATLPELAGELSTPTSQVVVAEVPALTAGVDTYKFVHPTTAGQVKVAEGVSVSLEALGVGRAVMMTAPTSTLGQAPAVEPVATPRLRGKVARDGRVRLRWSRADGVASTRVWVKQAGRSWRSVGRKQGRTVRVEVRPGRVAFRVASLDGGDMSGYSNVVRLRVRSAN